MEDYALIAKHEVIADDGDAIASSTLYKAANAIYEGKVPKAFQPFWAGGRLIALVKPNGKLRPIVIGEALRCLVGSVVIKGHKTIRAKLQSTLPPLATKVPKVPPVPLPNQLKLLS